MLDIMDRCQSSPRPALKENGPVSGKFLYSAGHRAGCNGASLSLCVEVIIFPAFRRYKLFGSGGYKIRKLLEDTGWLINYREENV